MNAGPLEGTAVTTNPRNIRPGAHLEPLDAIDERLLEALVNDARISNKQLAELVGIAPSTALMRTRALSERGIVQGYEAKLNLSAIGRSVQALVAVRLRAHDRDQIDRFTSRVPHLPAVLSTFHTSGSVDYLLHIAVGSTEDLRDWVLDNLATDPVVGHTETTLVFEHIQGNHGPLPE
jgi:DNA-binding Lrp family transcriptional regulator